MEKQKTTFMDLLKYMITFTLICVLVMFCVYFMGFAESITEFAYNTNEAKEYREIQTNYTNFLFEDNKRLNNELLTTLNESNNWKEAYNLCQQDNFRLYEELNN